MSRAPIRIPVGLVLLDLAGAVLAALGFYGLIDDRAAQTLPFLAERTAPLALLVLGLGLMGYAIVALISRLARDARASRDASDGD